MAYINLRCLAEQYSWFGIAMTVVSIVYLFVMDFFRDSRFKQVKYVLIPTFAACLGLFALMSFQAVFFERNFSIMWPMFFLCCTTSWWYAAGIFSERRGYANPKRFQTILLLIVTVICLVKALWLDVLIGPERDWWRYHF